MTILRLEKRIEKGREIAEKMRLNHPVSQLESRVADELDLQTGILEEKLVQFKKLTDSLPNHEVTYGHSLLEEKETYKQLVQLIESIEEVEDRVMSLIDTME